MEFFPVTISTGCTGKYNVFLKISFKKVGENSWMFCLFLLDCINISDIIKMYSQVGCDFLRENKNST